MKLSRRPVESKRLLALTDDRILEDLEVVAVDIGIERYAESTSQPTDRSRGDHTATTTGETSIINHTCS